MNRRGFLQGLAALFASTAIPLPVETAGRAFVGWKVYTRAVVLNEEWMATVEMELPEELDVEEVQIGDFRRYLAPEDAPRLIEQMKREARAIVGHDEIEHTHLPPTRGPRPYDQVGWVGWKADRPRVGWRERMQEQTGAYCAPFTL